MTEAVRTAGPGRAAVWHGPEVGFTVEDLPFPELANQEALVTVELATICGSDIHTIAGDRPTPLPTVLGHEAVGVITNTEGMILDANGSEIGPGDRVTWTIGTACGRCRRCRHGVSQKCTSVRKYGHEAMTDHWQLNGGLATHCHLLSGTSMVKVPTDLPAKVIAPGNCATATVVSAARRVDLCAADNVIVIGCGMLGLTVIAYARDIGVESVIACDLDPVRRELAGRFGATAACAPEDLAETTAASAEADVVFELSGSSQAVRTALRTVTMAGRIALVGSVSPGPEVCFDPSSVVKHLTTVVGCHNYRADDLVEAVAFLTRTTARQNFEDLIPEPFTLSGIDAAVDAARTSRWPRIPVRMV